MRRAPAAAALAAALLAGCAGPGYRVRLEARGVRGRERDLLLGDLERTARSSGFTTVVDRRRTARGPLPAIASSREKRLSDAPGDRISLDVFWFAAGDAVRVEVEHPVRGADPAVRAELDALGDACLSDLAARAGRSRVSVERGRTRPAAEP
jgi:hypothetical protein